MDHDDNMTPSTPNKAMRYRASTRTGERDHYWHKFWGGQWESHCGLIKLRDELRPPHGQGHWCEKCHQMGVNDPRVKEWK